MKDMEDLVEKLEDRREDLDEKIEKFDRSSRSIPYEAKRDEIKRILDWIKDEA